MKRNICAIVITSLGLAGVAKADVPFRWTQSYVQGWVNAAVDIKGGGFFQIACNDGGSLHPSVTDISIGYFYPGNKHVDAIKGPDTLQFVISGKTYIIPGSGTQQAPNSLDFRSNFESFLLFESSLMESKQEYFAFQIPEKNLSINVSTIGAKQALSVGKNNGNYKLITDYCTGIK